MMRRRTPAADPSALDPDRVFARLAGRRGLILAVSGGPDSTGLMLLASRWRARPPVLVVTVDHGLRPEAAEEAELVARNAARLGLPCRIMHAEGRRTGNLQNWARQARYACLTQAARDAGFDTIVTAHHQDDQAETFLLRLARGSGVYGLSGMREEELREEIVLARPLLGIPPNALHALVAAEGLETVSDPSNADPRFDRVRMRALLPTLAEQGLDPRRLAETAAGLARAASALDHYAGEFLQAHFSVDPFGVADGSLEKFPVLPEEVELRVLARILQAVGGADYTPPLAGIEALRDAILEVGCDRLLKRTLSGVVVSVAAGRLVAAREWGRTGLAAAFASAGANIVWDGRFRVDVPDIPGVLKIGALGCAETRLRSRAANRSTLNALPGLFQDGTLVAAPFTVRAGEKTAPLDILAAECIVGQRLGLGSLGKRVAR